MPEGPAITTAVTDPPITVRRNFARPAAEQIRKFHDVPVCWLVDAMGRQGGLDTRIRPLTRANRLCGPALTVDATAHDHITPFAALAFAQPGDVLVIRTGATRPHAIAGDNLLGMCRNSGVAGLVTDGQVRDIAGIDGYGMVVFATGTSPNSPSVPGPCCIGLPIMLGGVVIDAGDLVVADEEGVAIVPRGRLETVAAALEAVRAKEAAMEAAVKGGQRMPDWVDAALAARARYLD